MTYAYVFGIYNYNVCLVFISSDLIGHLGRQYFYLPVFRRDVLWYGDVRSSIHQSIRPSGSPSVSHSFPHFSPTCFDKLSWNFACHFLYMNIQSSSSIVGVMPLLELRILEIQFSAVFSYMLWHIELKLSMSLFLWSFDQVRVSSFSVPREDAQGFKSRIRPPYPQRVVKGD